MGDVPGCRWGLFLLISFIDWYDCTYVVCSMCLDERHICMEPAALAVGHYEGDPSVVQREGILRFSSLLRGHCEQSALKRLCQRSRYWRLARTSHRGELDVIDKESELSSPAIHNSLHSHSLLASASDVMSLGRLGKVLGCRKRAHLFIPAILLV